MKLHENLQYAEQYQYLEDLRKSGVTNMFGAIPYLRDEYPELTYNEARAILSSWMRNYSELKEQFGW